MFDLTVFRRMCSLDWKKKMMKILRLRKPWRCIARREASLLVGVYVSCRCIPRKGGIIIGRCLRFTTFCGIIFFFAFFLVKLQLGHSVSDQPMVCESPLRF